MTSQVHDDVVEVRVRADVRPPGSLGRLLPDSTVVGSATAWLEPETNAGTGPEWLAPDPSAGTGPTP
jgi:hypothetical protein